MAKKRDTVLADVAGKIGSTLGIIAAEAAKVVRPLRAKRARRSRSQAHAPAPALTRRATASGRSTRRHTNARRRAKRSS
jgi:hypothetical protein